MEYRYLGRIGLKVSEKVSELCLGTMPFGAQTDDADSARIMDAVVAAGGPFIGGTLGSGIQALGATAPALRHWRGTRPARA